MIQGISSGVPFGYKLLRHETTGVAESETSASVEEAETESDNPYQAFGVPDHVWETFEQATKGLDWEQRSIAQLYINQASIKPNYAARSSSAA